MNTEYLLDHLMILIIASIALIIIKSIAGVASTFLLGCPLRAAILTGFALSQVGEFSFVLSRLGVEYSLMTEEAYQAFLAVSIITMGVTPFLINASYKPIDFLVTRVSGTTNGLKLIHGLYSEPIKEEEQAEPEMKDHLIIVGFGFSGRTVSKAAKAAGIPYIIVEANPEIVIQEKQKGENIHYGDATFEVVLEHAGVKSARVLIIGISDSTATGKIVEIVKKIESEHLYHRKSKGSAGNETPQFPGSG
ncbi:NAD-binding protein [Methanosarcina barkeri]|uniref:NAD-binding protein n=1 Tax=Methanosarcina barkeri TaxID=2208 RepID=UPI001FB2DB2F|nr:NAD-binding protein [Methanosarcina barkeri]